MTTVGSVLNATSGNDADFLWLQWRYLYNTYTIKLAIRPEIYNVLSLKQPRGSPGVNELWSRRSRNISVPMNIVSSWGR